MELLLVIMWGAFWGALCAWLAGEKGRGQGSWFLLGLFFTFLALIILAVAPSKVPAPVSPVSTGGGSAPSSGTSLAAGAPGPEATTKKCPMCAESVMREAKICRFCRYEFTDADEAALQADEAARQAAAAALPRGPFRWRVLDSSWAQLPVGREGTVTRVGGLLHLAFGHQAYAVDASKFSPSIEEGALRLDNRRDIRVDLSPLDGRNVTEGLAELGFAPGS